MEIRRCITFRTFRCRQLVTSPCFLFFLIPPNVAIKAKPNIAGSARVTFDADNRVPRPLLVLAGRAPGVSAVTSMCTVDASGAQGRRCRRGIKGPNITSCYAPQDQQGSPRRSEGCVTADTSASFESQNAISFLADVPLTIKKDVLLL